MTLAIWMDLDVREKRTSQCLWSNWRSWLCRAGGMDCYSCPRYARLQLLPMSHHQIVCGAGYEGGEVRRRRLKLINRWIIVGFDCCLCNSLASGSKLCWLMSLHRVNEGLCLCNWYPSRTAGQRRIRELWKLPVQMVIRSMSWKRAWCEWCTLVYRADFWNSILANFVQNLEVNPWPVLT